MLRKTQKIGEFYAPQIYTRRRRERWERFPYARQEKIPEEKRTFHEDHEAHEGS
jgi:hypothetical protein